MFRRNRWFAAAGVVTLAYAGLCAMMPRGQFLTTLTDVGYLLIIIAICGTTLVNAAQAQGAIRRFWALMASGYILWAANQVAWTYCEVWRHADVPDPWFMDMFLFLHLIPMIAAVGLRPGLADGETKIRVGTLDFLMLLVWWVFLYAFIVLPSQYVSLDVATYDRNYGVLYVVESSVLVLVLGIVGRRATLGWKTLYLNLMVANIVYAIASQGVNLGIPNGTYYSGSFYDVPLIACVSWMAATILSARDWQLQVTPPSTIDRWGAVAPRLAILAILSLPLLGLWAFRWDNSPASTRMFRICSVLAAMLVLGAFVFMRQYRQDQTLIRLLEDSRRSFENEKRLQNHLVQREKLAALGQLVAGAAQEIDYPLTAIMADSERLWSKQRLTEDQDKLLRKIVHHSQRTRELISSLLNFAQHSAGEKMMVDLSMLLQRSVHMREMQNHDQKIRIETFLEPSLPKVWGDGHLLFQAFVQIVENAQDALEEAGGGWLRVSAQVHHNEVIIQFSDNGPGIKEPHRVFDPFYTTKPVGKGTGLGLSAVYGVVQEHQGQITCQNNPEGGALFMLRLPVVARSDPQALAAAQS